MLLSRSELDATAVMHPDVAEFYKARPPPKTIHVDTSLMRSTMVLAEKVLAQRAGPCPDDMVEQYHSITMRDGYSSPIKICRPATPTHGPLWVLLFGGGFVSGSHEQHTGNARMLTRLFGATVVSISYRLAPEWKFPTAPNDSIDSTRWVADNASGPLLLADPAKGFVLGGVSAGAALTAVCSRYFQAHPLPVPLTAQWLSVPSIMSTESCPAEYRDVFLSLEQNALAPSLNSNGMEITRAAVQPDDTSDLRYAVLSKTPLEQQPRTYFHVDGMDPLRDSGLIYHEMLQAAGVPVKIDLYPGCPHTFQYSMPMTGIGRKANIDTVVGFGWLLGQEVTRDQAAEVLKMVSM